MRPRGRSPAGSVYVALALKPDDPLIPAFCEGLRSCGVDVLEQGVLQADSSGIWFEVTPLESGSRSLLEQTVPRDRWLDFRPILRGEGKIQARQLALLKVEQ